VDTPEFLIWAIEFACPIRGQQDGSDPERTERQLRAARAVSDARNEGRVLEGFCVQPPDGFRITDVMSIYGGLDVVERHCGDCPANAANGIKSLAGCFGLLPLSPDGQQFHAAVDAAITAAGLAQQYEELFLPTLPRWHGLWIASPLTTQQQAFIAQLSRHVDSALKTDEWHDFERGLAMSLAAKLTFHIALYPAGRVDLPWWKLVSHCPRCKGAWSDARSRQCAICGYMGHPAPDKKRRARGRRPYFPLERLLGARQAAEFLARYEVFRRR
jgi:hypothetical protein